MHPVEHFYDDLTDIYDLVYEDWPRSIERQAKVLETVIRARNPEARSIADVACGIGTQSLGLAARGFQLTGSDLSSKAVERAKLEAAARGLDIDFRVDDMERLETYGDASFDVVIACDNALPHLLQDEQIANALRRFREVLKPGGLCLFSVRDYAEVGERDRPLVVPYGMRERENGRTLLFQVWDFFDDCYDLSFYFVFDDGKNVTTRVFRSRYSLITVDRLMALAREAGFSSVERLDDVFFQPLIVARRGEGG